MPDLKINGSNGNLAVSPDEPVSVTLGLAAGNHSGERGDWWVVMSMSPSGVNAGPPQWYTFDFQSKEWVQNVDLTVGYQGPLVDQTPEEIWAVPTTAVGKYTFFSRVDRVANGEIDETHTQDCLTVSSEAQ